MEYTNSLHITLRDAEHTEEEIEEHIRDALIALGLPDCVIDIERDEDELDELCLDIDNIPLDMLMSVECTIRQLFDDENLSMARDDDDDEIADDDEERLPAQKKEEWEESLWADYPWKENEDDDGDFSAA